MAFDNLTGWQTELFDCCEFGDLEGVCNMLANGVDPKMVHPERGETPLHWAARYGALSVVKHLIEVVLCDPNISARDGSTPLYLACRENRGDVVAYLLKNPDVYPSMRDTLTGQTPLHWACKKGDLETVKCLIEERMVNPNCKDDSGQTPLHLACRWGHLAVIEYLVKNPNVDSNCADNSGQTPLYKACSCGHREITECLLKGPHIDINCSESNGWTPLHWACEWGFLGIVKTLVEERHADPNSKDSKGYTPLHWACRCRYGRDVLLKYLVEHTNADFNCVTSDGQTAFDIIQSTDGISLLLSLGATPNFDLEEQHFPSYLRLDSGDMSIKMFVLGNTGSGKSTLSKSLKSDRKGFSRFKSRFIKVRNVDNQTAGIIPYDVIRKAMGSITVFDFAGDKMFYAGHDALLSNSMANSPSVILLTVDLSDRDEKFREILVYWLEFISNRCSERGPRPHLILVGSHVDQSKDVEAKSQLMKSLATSSRFNGFTFAGQVTLDCRFAESSSMTELCSLLSQSCHTLRSSQEMPFKNHCFLGFLLEKFSDTPALTLGTAELKLAEASKEELYLTFLKLHNLFEICEQLNERGNILFMKNHTNPQNSWIILNKAVLLSHVFGAVFAPQGFKQHRAIANSSGIVSLSNLVNLFPTFDSDMIIQFLCHMRFCQEVLNHQFLPCLQIQSNNISSSSTERFFLFPGLMQLDVPNDLWQSGSDWKYHSGWIFQCSNKEQFFSPRFLQVLLLQIFSLATSCLSTHQLIQQKECRIWNKGIAWTTANGVEVIVEVMDSKTVVVLTRCKTAEKLEMVQLRSSVIRNVLMIRNETCPKIAVHESLIISPGDALHYPLSLSSVTTVSVCNIAQAVIKGVANVSIENDASVELESLLQFEPYAQLGEEIVRELFQAENGFELTDERLQRIASLVPHKLLCFKAIMSTPPRQQTDGHDLLSVLQLWRDEGNRKLLKDLCDVWNQYSVFAGRNIFQFL